MSCQVCKSVNQAEFPSEMNIHLSCTEDRNRSSVFLFPQVLVFGLWLLALCHRESGIVATRWG